MLIVTGCFDGLKGPYIKTFIMLFSSCFRMPVASVTQLQKTVRRSAVWAATAQNIFFGEKLEEEDVASQPVPLQCLFLFSPIVILSDETKVSLLLPP